MWVLWLLGLGLGLMVLVWSAQVFVDGASDLAQRWGLSPMIIGLTVVSLGTSAPEVVVSVIAAWEGRGALAVGNVIGSNIANITLVLGLTVMVCPIPSELRAMRSQLLWLWVVTVVLALLLLDGMLSRFDGSLLAIGCVLLVWRVWSQSQPASVTTVTTEGWQRHLWLVGLLGLLLSAEWVVHCAVIIAQAWGWSEYVIGVTLVAIGTSLPEIATTLSAARQQAYDLVLGNLIGSNLFNILLVLPFPIWLQSGLWSDLSYGRDLGMLLGSTALLWLLSYWPGPLQLGRVLGTVLLGSYGWYLGALVLGAHVVA